MGIAQRPGDEIRAVAGACACLVALCAVRRSSNAGEAEGRGAQPLGGMGGRLRPGGIEKGGLPPSARAF